MGVGCGPVADRRHNPDQPGAASWDAARDVAEGIAREARLLLFEPRVLAMDAFPVAALPAEPAVVFVASTTGQARPGFPGDPPDNMRRFWRFLLRKSLAADSLAATRYAVFGLGDSGYVKFNSAAKKLDRRLAALGAIPLLERGLGDDQHSGGYDAALDPWLQQLWPALRAAFPLPPGVEQPVLDAAARLQLGPPKYKGVLLDGPTAAAAADPALSSSAGGAADEEQLQREATAAAAGFRAVAAEASGMPAVASAAPGPANGHAGTLSCGPWRPFFAPLLVNRRLTSPDHFQDTRHLEFGLSGSGFEYEPGDLLAIFPRTPEADVQGEPQSEGPHGSWGHLDAPPSSAAMLARLGLDGRQLVRVEAARPAAGGAPSLVATAHALVQGVLDVSGASPRRYLFQVLQHYATSEREKERLAYFASPEGRDDLYE
ncbi:hypothetical protein MNEG_12672 [Monoraphidium neglectum]|uniref:Flavodoxin-like domain-containing protein n=1 Tax=Monoraphidium neglectum TaxID=145388 RepID=A0A0D2LUG0_9CHLO|nr:hypothetical protein MNEG_12672 [Monoraphidium neglectum]KIY95289.1 hypothetical protein MNEG_12672 [Monoraphidium neglectum]|eukprot:XP_013894309.1 hypothetical protein MNEG_12672 [Monoraphidium neglectum]